MLDANESWNRAQAVRHVSALERDVDLTWIEEPVRRWDVAGHGRGARHGPRRSRQRREPDRSRAVSGRSSTPDAVDIVQVGTVWGITHFLRVAALAHASDLPVSPVAYHANPLAHAAAAVPNLLAFEVQDLVFPIGLDVDQEFEDGGIVLGRSPGPRASWSTRR